MHLGCGTPNWVIIQSERSLATLAHCFMSTCLCDGLDALNKFASKCGYGTHRKANCGFHRNGRVRWRRWIRLRTGVLKVDKWWSSGSRMTIGVHKVIRIMQIRRPSQTQTVLRALRYALVHSNNRFGFNCGKISYGLFARCNKVAVED